MYKTLNKDMIKGHEIWINGHMSENIKATSTGFIPGTKAQYWTSEPERFSILVSENLVQAANSDQQ